MYKYMAYMDICNINQKHIIIVNYNIFSMCKLSTCFETTFNRIVIIYTPEINIYVRPSCIIYIWIVLYETAQNFNVADSTAHREIDHFLCDGSFIK